jgi:hypothetical protein
MVSLGVLCVFAYLICKFRDNKYTVFYFIYAFLSSVVFDNNKYIMLAFFALGSFINYIIRKDKERDLFVGALYTCALVLTEFLVYDIDANDISILVAGVYMIYAMLLSRNIIKKHMQDYKVLEYILFIIINLIAIFRFSSEIDGLLFIIYLVCLVIYSYIKKYGPLFLVSLIFIVINIVRLTEDFWLNLPWWLYVLLIGAVLIAFAVNNELRDKKNNGQIVKKIKDDLDL